MLSLFLFGERHPYEREKSKHKGTFSQERHPYGREKSSIRVPLVKKDTLMREKKAT